MTRNVNILKELNELKSSLPAQVPENPYTVPSGYFETLAEQVMLKIKASEAKTASDELQMVSPLLSGIAKKSPYTVPAGYFEGLEEKLMDGIRKSADYQTRDEELREISPLLSGLKKEIPFSIPEGYFKSLSVKTIRSEQEEKSHAKVISITARKWLRYAAAAVVIGFVAFAGLKLLNKNSSGPENAEARIEKKLDKDFKKERITTDEVENFLDLTESLVATETRKTPNLTNQINTQNLLKDISDNEIVTFLDQLPEETELEMFE